MGKYVKTYEFLQHLLNKYPNFKKIFDENILTGKIRFFGDEEFSKIRSQNFVSPVSEAKDFEDIFILGYNIGDCVGTSRQLSYSYDNVDIVSGILPILKGTLNAEEEGGHCWLETPKFIIDTSLMLVIDKSLKDEIGYIEEQRITSNQLLGSQYYQARKDFVNDSFLNGKKRM